MTNLISLDDKKREVDGLPSKGKRDIDGCKDDVLVFVSIVNHGRFITEYKFIYVNVKELPEQLQMLNVALPSFLQSQPIRFLEERHRIPKHIDFLFKLFGTSRAKFVSRLADKFQKKAMKKVERIKQQIAEEEKITNGDI